MKSARYILRVAATLLSFALSPAAMTAPILWEPVQNTTGADDVDTTGISVEAFNATDLGSSGSVVVNGVAFSNTGALLPSDSTADFLAGSSTGDANLDILLGSLDYGGGSTEDINIGDGLLEVGKVYLLQVFFTDLRGCCDSRTMTFGDGLGGTVDVAASSSSGFGQNAIGYFTADATLQTLSLATNGFNNTHITAYQVRQIPAPGILALISFGLVGIGYRRFKAV
jgi:hypothetical protein